MSFALGLGLISTLAGCAYVIEDCDAEWKDTQLSYETFAYEDQLEFLVNFPRGTDWVETAISGNDYDLAFSHESLGNKDGVAFLPEGLEPGTYGVKLRAASLDCEGIIDYERPFTW